MDTNEILYDAFAELIYSVLMADGIINQNELNAISQITKTHPIRDFIQKHILSNQKDISISQSFLHTMEVCKSLGNREEYPALLEMVQEIGKVSGKFEEDSLLSDFVANFKQKFSLG
jgi:hypothetical protein